MRTDFLRQGYQRGPDTGRSREAMEVPQMRSARDRIQKIATSQWYLRSVTTFYEALKCDLSIIRHLAKAVCSLQQTTNMKPTSSTAVNIVGFIYVEYTAINLSMGSWGAQRPLKLPHMPVLSLLASF